MFKITVAKIRTFFEHTTNEKIILIPFLWGVLVYIAIYGKYITQGFSIERPDSGILIIFIPILFIDCLKILLECSTPFSFKTDPPEAEDLENVTVIIPTKDGEGTLEATLEDLVARFPKENIIVSSNGSTDNTVSIAQSYGVKVLDIKKGIGKIPAINKALTLVETEYCLTMDDDVRLGNAHVPTTLLSNATGVAFRVFPIVTNWVTVLQSHEYRKSMDIGKNFHNKSATVQNISGAIGLFKTCELRRQQTLHTGEFSGEDLQRTLIILLSSKGNKVVLSDSIVYTEVPQSISALYAQRVFGWSPGFLSNVKKFVQLICAKNTHPKLRYEAFYTVCFVVLTDPLRLIALPILVWYPIISCIVYIVYVLLECIPYIKLGRKEPVWVIFVMPLYGVMMYLARVTGTVVFFYRRFAVLFSHKRHLDDYRQVSLKYRFMSLSISFIFFTLIFCVMYALDRLETGKIIIHGIESNL